MKSGDPPRKKSAHTMLAAAAIVLVLAAAVPVALYVLCVHMPGSSWAGPPPALSGQETALRERLRAHVEQLAGGIGERNFRNMDGLDRAADYVETQWKEMNFVPASQVYGEENFRNIVVDLYGRERREELLVVGAHYDTAWGTPGADDNASGVAALLEISRALRDRPLRRSVRFIAFTNEERPYLHSGSMGSRVNAKRSYERNEQIVGMLSLEMLGFYSDERRSQGNRGIIRRFYPRTGNFIAFVSNLGSRGFLHQSIDAFRRHARLPSEGLAAPAPLVADVLRSDNASFVYYGFPAVMVTDTANFRNYNYHTAADLPRTLDFERFSLVTSGLVEMIADLANR